MASLPMYSEMKLVEEGVELLNHDPAELGEPATWQNRNFKPRWAFPSHRWPHHSNIRFLPILIWLRNTLLHTLAEMIPSFIARRYLPHLKVTPLPSPKLHQTSWLDGLRGVAAMAVIAFHWVQAVLANGNTGYGEPRSGRSSSLLQLPIIRLSYAGLANVAIFFVISGYALSVRPVQLMARPNADGGTAMKSFGSSVFRRFFRLYLPMWASTVPPFLWKFLEMDTLLNRWPMFGFISNGAYMQAVENLRSPIYNYSISTVDTMVLPSNSTLPLTTRGILNGPSFWEESLKLVQANLRSTTIFEGSWSQPQYENPYNPPTWTIPVEFRASLVLFLVHVALFQIKPAARICITFGLMVYSVYANRFEMILFLGGFLIAQLDPLISLLEERLAERSRKVQRSYELSLMFIFIIGLHLASLPPWNPGETPGFIWLTHYIPSCFTWSPAWFWFGNGAMLIIFAIGRLPTLADLFRSQINQYLGQISFSIYLLHIIIETAFGVPFLYHFGNWTSNLDRHNQPLFQFGFAMSMLYVWVLCIWFGDIWCRFVDIPSVKVTKWIETRLQV
jgi:peptidoglycan/LPS O-acetylase OafA/YrhL